MEKFIMPDNEPNLNYLYLLSIFGEYIKYSYNIYQDQKSKNNSFDAIRDGFIKNTLEREKNYLVDVSFAKLNDAETVQKKLEKIKSYLNIDVNLEQAKLDNEYIFFSQTLELNSLEGILNNKDHEFLSLVSNIINEFMFNTNKIIYFIIKMLENKWSKISEKNRSDKEDAENKVEGLNQQKFDLQNKIISLENTINEMRSTLQQNEQEMNQMRNTLQQNEQKMNQMRNTLQQNEQKMNEMKKQYDEILQAKDKMQASYDTIISRLESIESNILKKENDTQDKFASYQLLIDKVLKENSSLQTQNKDLGLKIAELEKEKIRLNLELDKNKSQIDSLNNCIDVLNLKLEKNNQNQN